MTSIQDQPVDLVAAAFTRACAELIQARRRQHEKDSRGHRADVAECRARIDVVLDLFLELHKASRESERSTECLSPVGTPVG